MAPVLGKIQIVPVLPNARGMGNAWNVLWYIRQEGF